MPKRARSPGPAKASKKQKTAPPDASKLPKELYDRCIATKPVGSEFTDKELLAFGITKKPKELIEICNELLRTHLLSLKIQTQHGLTYRTRSKATAVELAKSKQDVLMIYDCVESFQTSGIWKRNIASRTGLHDNVVTKGLKKLISRGLVKEINSAKAVAKRIYMLSFLEPDEENTGGRFFTEGEIDMGMIEGLSRFVLAEIQERSWVEQPGPATVPKEAKSRKRKADEMEAVDVSDRPEYDTPKGPNGRPLVPRPPGYSEYPTVADMDKIIQEAGILKDVELTKADVRQLLTKLELDGRLERMATKGGGFGYRTVRQFYTRSDRGEDWYGPLDPDPHGFGPGNGFTQTPCGRCPVFKNCTPGGMVSPETCVYMAEWLSW